MSSPCGRHKEYQNRENFKSSCKHKERKEDFFNISEKSEIAGMSYHSETGTNVIKTGKCSGERGFVIISHHHHDNARNRKNHKENAHINHYEASGFFIYVLALEFNSGYFVRMGKAVGFFSEHFDGHDDTAEFKTTRS